MTVEERMLDDRLIPTDTLAEDMAYVDNLEELGGFRLSGQLLMDESFGDVWMDVDGRMVGVCSELIGYLGGRAKRVELWMYESDVERGGDDTYVEAVSLFGECEMAYGLALTSTSKTRRIRTFAIDGEDVRELLRSYVNERVTICVLSSESSRDRVAYERLDREVYA